MNLSQNFSCGWYVSCDNGLIVPFVSPDDHMAVYRTLKEAIPAVEAWIRQERSVEMSCPLGIASPHDVVLPHAVASTSTETQIILRTLVYLGAKDLRRTIEQIEHISLLLTGLIPDYIAHHALNSSNRPTRDDLHMRFEPHQLPSDRVDMEANLYDGIIVVTGYEKSLPFARWMRSQLMIELQHLLLTACLISTLREEVPAQAFAST